MSIKLKVHDIDCLSAYHSLRYLRSTSNQFLGPYHPPGRDPLCSAALALPIIPDRSRSDHADVAVDQIVFDLGKQIGTGRTWDAFRATVASNSSRIFSGGVQHSTRPPTPPPSTQTMILKFMCPQTFVHSETTSTSTLDHGHEGHAPSTRHESRADLTGDGYTQEMVSAAVVNELMVYDVLKDLQGNAIPRYYGIFGGVQDEVDVWVAIMQDAGTPIRSIDARTA